MLPCISGVGLRIPAVPRKDQFLSFDASFDNHLRRIPVGKRHFIPCYLEVLAVCPPAKQALLCAIESRRRHLYALVSLYSVKFLFVARVFHLSVSHGTIRTFLLQSVCLLNDILVSSMRRQDQEEHWFPRSIALRKPGFQTRLRNKRSNTSIA